MFIELDPGVVFVGAGDRAGPVISLRDTSTGCIQSHVTSPVEPRAMCTPSGGFSDWISRATIANKEDQTGDEYCSTKGRSAFEMACCAANIPLSPRGNSQPGDPFEEWPDIRLPRGTAADLIDSDRGEA
jgi:hypothetical protein